MGVGFHYQISMPYGIPVGTVSTCSIRVPTLFFRVVELEGLLSY